MNHFMDEGFQMGNDLFKNVTTATGLPEGPVSAELERLLIQAGLNKAEMSLEDLRQILAEYVQDVLLAAKEHYTSEVPAAAGTAAD
jgi:hypothetical protein